MNELESELQFRATAFHEAGHALALVYFGQHAQAWIHSREAHADLPSIKDRLGQCHIPPDPLGKSQRPMGCQQKRVWSLAGPLAEYVADDDGFIPDCDSSWFESAFALIDEETNADWPKDCTESQCWHAARQAMRIISCERRLLFQIAEALIKDGRWTSYSFDSMRPPVALPENPIVKDGLAGL